MRRVFVVLSCVALVVSGLVVGSATASAASGPTLTVRNLRPHISATGHAKFSFVAKNVKSGSRVVLQRHSSSGWHTIDRTGKHSYIVTGGFTAKSTNKLGHYYYRLAIYRNGKRVLTGKTRSVYAYGKVSMYHLCTGVLDNYCPTGTNTLDDGSKFRWAMATGVNEPSDGFTADVAAPSNSCRAIKFTYISDSQDNTNTYLELRQPGQKAQKHTSSSAKVGSFVASLTGGKFQMSVQQDAAQVFMYFNGYGSCWSSTGKR